MRRIIPLLLVLLLLVPTSFAYTVPDDTKVYITPNGEKYHRKGCTYLNSTVAILSIESAESRGYDSCSRCNPDYLTSSYVPPSKEKKQDSNTPQSSPDKSATSTVSAKADAPKTGSLDSLKNIISKVFWVCVLLAYVSFYAGIPLYGYFVSRKKKRRR